MKTSLLAIAACSVLIGSVLAGEHPEHPKAPPPAAGPGLDGKVFTGELGKSGDTKSDKDTLTFKDGKFLSSACVAYGFHEPPYTATDQDGVTTFAATATNDKGETMSWTGTVKGSTLEATAVSGETTYTFKGKAGALKTKRSEHPSEHPEHPKP